MRENEYRNIQNIALVQANSGFGETITQKGQGKMSKELAKEAKDTRLSRLLDAFYKKRSMRKILIPKLKK